MKRHLGTYILGLIFVSSCTKGNINSFKLEPFDQDGVLTEAFLDKFQTPVLPDSIGIYIESSGSMNGLFRKNYPTKFKHNVSAIIMDNEIASRTISGKVFDRNCIPIEYTIRDFKDKMNNGEFVSQASTDVPSMLQVIINELKEKTHDVAVFISDMKYAPIKNSKVKSSQYDIEIKSLFSTISDKSVSVIGCESEYIRPDGKIQCSTFPYYITIIGEPSKTLWIRNRILTILQEDKNVKGTLDFNYKFDRPNYTLVPSCFKGFSLNRLEVLKDSILKGRSYSLLGYNKSMVSSDFLIAADYNSLPKELLDSISIEDFEIDTRLKALQVRVGELSRKSDKSKYVKGVENPNVFIEFKMDGLVNYNEDVLSIRLKDRKNSTEWLKKYYGAISDSVCSKTVSIDDFLKGLTLAFNDRNVWQKTPMYIFITEKNN